MVERTIVGVDFSGAGDDNAVGNTWVTQGYLETENDEELKKGTLLLESCRQVSRKELTDILKASPNDAVAALDFPFSVPIAFAEHLSSPGSEMPSLWQSVAPMEFSEFKEKAKEFTDLLRVGDLHCSNAKPSLKMEGNPVMVNMTFRGMRMLHGLRKAGCRVPPLDDDGCNGATLLEVMPGSVLRAFKLPFSGFKGKKQTDMENRRKILRELPKNSNVNVINLRDFSEEAMFSDDALDSMVAAVAAAKWAIAEMDGSHNAFRKPGNTRKVADAFAQYQGKRKISPGIDQLTEEQAARKEGWIYLPNINPSP